MSNALLPPPPDPFEYEVHDTDKPPATPVTPLLGQDVYFRLDKGPHRGEDRPAKIVRVTDDGTAVLAVFTCGAEDGLTYGNCPAIVKAKHSYDADIGTWHVRRYG